MKKHPESWLSYVLTFLCSTLLSKKDKMLINIKISRIKRILWFIALKPVIYLAHEC